MRRAKILNESIHPENESTVAISTVGPQVDPQMNSPAASSKETKFLRDQNYWGVGPFRFRFSLQSFRLRRDFSLQRFSIAEATLLLIMAYLSSKGLGVIRQTIFNAVFGTGPAANAYYAAFRLPDTLFNLVAGGILINAFVPVFLSYEKEHGQKETWRLTSLVFNVMLVTLTVLVVTGEFLAPTFVNKFLVPGYSPSEQALTTTLTRIMLLQPLILGVGTVVTGVLSSKRQFLLPALSLAIYNIGLIGGLLVTLAIPGIGIYGPTFGVLVAVALQLLVQIPALLKQGVRYTFTWDLKNPGLHQVLRLLIPSTIGVIVSSIALIVDTAFTSYLPDKASLAAQHNAQMIFDLPVALLALALGQAALPKMSALAMANHYVRLRQLLLKVVSGTILLSIPIAILLCLIGRPLIHLLFQHGAFTKHSSSLTDLALIGYCIGLPGSIATELQARGFYALKDARTPLFTKTFALLARVGLILLLLRLLAGKNIILAIPLAASGAAASEALLLLLLLSLRLRNRVKLDKGMQRLQRWRALRIQKPAAEYSSKLKST